jgi:triosephosphate isomerase
MHSRALIRPAAGRFADMAIGGQDCHMAASGAHTGCISAEMLADAGAKLTIVGHSERRAAQGESDADIRGKALAAKRAGLVCHFMCGRDRSGTRRRAGGGRCARAIRGFACLMMQAKCSWLSVAYEPVWAIGTGRIPSVEDVKAMHAAIRAALVARFGADGANAIRILYGGSMNGDNAASLLAIPNVDGGLIGGASLKADKFSADRSRSGGRLSDKI